MKIESKTISKRFCTKMTDYAVKLWDALPESDKIFYNHLGTFHTPKITGKQYFIPFILLFGDNLGPGH